MDISLLNILRNTRWDFRQDMAQGYANALRNAIELHVGNDMEKKQGYFLSKKGTQKVIGNFEDKLYVGNIHRIENHLYWNDEELADDDQIIDVVMIDGPVTRDGGGCSYGTKDWRDQVMYANTIPQVVGHIFYINTPGGESACRNDYEMMINDCREKGKATVAFVDGMCASSGVNLACRCDRTIVMNPKDDFGCIGSMAAFWATPDGAVDQDGTRYVEIVGDESPDKNGWFRKAAEGDYEELKELVNNDTNEFHQTVRENRPLVTDDMLTGKVFEAQELIPALVDEIGDYNRAIECVFQLADGTLPAAHTVVTGGEQPKPEEPEEDPEETPDKTPDNHPDDPDEPGEQKDMATLNEQQKAAVAQSHGATLIVDDGHVKKSVDGFFGLEEQEIANPNNNKEMTDEEKKAQEAQEAQAAQEQQAPAGKQPATEGASAPEASASKQNDETKPDGEKPDGEKPDEEDAGKKDDPDSDTSELAKATDALHAAEELVADRDKIIEGKDAAIAEKESKIADLQKSIDEQTKQAADKDAAIAARDKSIEEKDALIRQLNKQVADLNGEVKELAAKPTPMSNGEGGIPKGNGTGAAGTGAVKSIIKPGMSPKEIREALRKQDKDEAEKQRHR